MTFLKDYELLDIAKRPIESGGSVNGKRIWILLQKNSEKLIYELKQKEESSMNRFAKQDSILNTWKHSDQVFEFSSDEQPLVQIGESNFILREKVVHLYDTPDPKASKKEYELFHELANYDAYMLGRWHRNQVKTEYVSNFDNYLSLVDNNPESFKSMIDWVISNYAEIMNEKLMETVK
jgi:hypothetical protein